MDDNKKIPEMTRMELSAYILRFSDNGRSFNDLTEDEFLQILSHNGRAFALKKMAEDPKLIEDRVYLLINSLFADDENNIYDEIKQDTISALYKNINFDKDKVNNYIRNNNLIKDKEAEQKFFDDISKPKVKKFVLGFID